VSESQPATVHRQLRRAVLDALRERFIRGFVESEALEIAEE
jgi:hypothetical protein